MRAVSTEETTASLAQLYRQDFYAWCLKTAELLASAQIEALDVPHLREEVEGLALRDEREVGSRMKLIMQHLLNWGYQPEKRTRSWDSTIATQRDELEVLFQQSPSLGQVAKRDLDKAYKRARHFAARETGLPEQTFPGECPYTLAQVLDPEFVPHR